MKRVGVIMGVALIALFVTISITAADETFGRLYPLPGHGKLRLEVPSGWVHQISQPANGLPPTIEFKNNSSNESFMILLTPIWPANPDTPPPSDKSIEQQVKNASVAIGSQSLEKILRISELKGTSGLGYYYFATDPAPKPGEYKYMTQGIIRIGYLSIPFTILTNNRDGNIIKDALIMLKTARHLTNAT